MPRQQKKEETDSESNNDTLTLLRLEQQVLKLTAARAVSPSFHLAHLFSVASHGRVPAAGSFPVSLHGCFVQVKVHLLLEPPGAISGILAGGIRSFGALDCFVTCTFTTILP